MLLLLSPAKSLDYSSPLPPAAEAVADPGRQPRWMDRSQQLINTLKPLSNAQIGHLMDISDKLADLNRARFQDWRQQPSPELVRPALYAFNGDVYEGLEAATLGPDDLAWADEHVRILSGLYGMLRPLDAMQPYRLEMGTRLANPGGADLYAFWKETLAAQLAAEATSMAEGKGDEPWLLNLASEEYFKAVQVGRPSLRVVSPVFQDEKAGQYKIISFYAKRARGLMARWAIDSRLSSAEALRDFTVAGYAFCDESSSPDKPVFRRPEGAGAAAA